MEGVPRSGKFRSAAGRLAGGLRHFRRRKGHLLDVARRSDKATGKPGYLDRCCTIRRYSRSSATPGGAMLITLLSALALAGVICAARLLQGAVARAAWPRVETIVLGAVTNFFDTLGIGFGSLSMRSGRCRSQADLVDAGSEHPNSTPSPRGRSSVDIPQSLRLTCHGWLPTQTLEARSLASPGHMDMQRPRDAGGAVASVAPTEPIGYAAVSATDAAELTQNLRDWNFEFTQLSLGKFSASGAVLDLDGVSIARLSMGRTLLQRGYAPRGMFAVFIPGAGSGPAYARGQLLETGQCATLTEGAELEAITHEGYLDVSFGVDLSACRPQLEALNGGSMGLSPGTSIAAPGPAWINDMLGRVDWLLAAVMEYAQCLGDQRVRASLADHALAAMVRFNNSPADVDATTRSARDRKS